MRLSSYLLGMPNIANASVCILYSNIGNNNNASNSNTVFLVITKTNPTIMLVADWEYSYLKPAKTQEVILVYHLQYTNIQTYILIL